MFYKLAAIFLVLCSNANLYCSADEWQNFIETCVFRDMLLSNEYGLNAHINNMNLSVYDLNHNSLGKFTCVVLKNKDFQYQSLEMELSDEAYKRKIESNACRQYPLRNDFNETFDISKKQEVRIVTYRPVGSPFDMQTISSIKLNGVEQIHMPTQSEMHEARSVIGACRAHANSQLYNPDCEFEDIFKIYKIKINEKLVWCYVQNKESTKQVDMDISNNNYKFYETYPRLDVIRHIKNNYVILNSREHQIRSPRIIAVHQKNVTEKSPSISFVRVNSKAICTTPLVEKTVNCGRPVLEVEPFEDTVYPGQYPWIVFVYANRSGWELVGEGTLIDHDTIITGGGCVMNSTGGTFDGKNLRILLNKYEKNDTPDESDFLAVRKVIVSEFYSKKYNEYDIALIKLEKPFDSFLNVTMPICTTNNNQLFNGLVGVVTGFGLDRTSKPLTQLSQTHIERIRPDVCRRRDGFFRAYLHENTYCAEYVNGSNICPEMSGSGMYIKVKDVWMLSGIVTIGVATGDRCSLSAISLYSDTTTLHGFIEDNRS